MKKRAAFISVILVVFLYFLPECCWAFRCGSGLVGSGDTKTKVLITCGSPTFKETSCAKRQEYSSTDKSGKVKKIKKCSQKTEVWHYNCGENDFIYKLTFENGILKNENTEGRGKGKSDCLGK